MQRELSREYFVSLSQGLINGKWVSVLTRFKCPLVVFGDERPQMFSSRRHIEAVASVYCDVLVRNGVQAAMVEAVEICRHNGPTRSYLVKKSYLRWDASQAGEVTARYFLREDDGMHKVEMIEYLRNPFLKMVTAPQFLHAA